MRPASAQVAFRTDWEPVFDRHSASCPPGFPRSARFLLEPVDKRGSQMGRSLIHMWTYMDPARLQQVGWIRIAGHNC
jgi:hypothetical protein